MSPKTPEPVAHADEPPADGGFHALLDGLADYLAGYEQRHARRLDPTETAEAVAEFLAEKCIEPSGDDHLHRKGEPLTDAEFREAAVHIWLNAFSCIRPSDEFAADVGRDVIRQVMQQGLRTEGFGDYEGSRAAVIWINAS